MEECLLEPLWGGRGLWSLVSKTVDALALGKQATQAFLVYSSFTCSHAVRTGKVTLRQRLEW